MPQQVDLVAAEEIEQLHDLIMAQYEMSLYERRIFIKTIELLPDSVIDPQGIAVFEPIYIDAREIISDSNLKGKSAFLELQKATKSLIRHVCHIAEQDGFATDGSDEFGQVSEREGSSAHTH